jgi:hypothetical protein
LPLIIEVADETNVYKGSVIAFTKPVVPRPVN